ncbi:MAG: hypothetical protein M1831_001000 [Alyxoria varia]|nr:MAG: hypothetical protein M1831_001000 [Alyxoria varia]
MRINNQGGDFHDEWPGVPGYFHNQGLNATLSQQSFPTHHDQRHPNFGGCENGLNDGGSSLQEPDAIEPMTPESAPPAWTVNPNIDSIANRVSAQLTYGEPDRYLRSFQSSPCSDHEFASFQRQLAHQGLSNTYQNLHPLLTTTADPNPLDSGIHENRSQLSTPLSAASTHASSSLLSNNNPLTPSSSVNSSCFGSDSSPWTSNFSSFTTNIDSPTAATTAGLRSFETSFNCGGGGVPLNVVTIQGENSDSSNPSNNTSHNNEDDNTRFWYPVDTTPHKPSSRNRRKNRKALSHALSNHDQPCTHRSSSSSASTATSSSLPNLRQVPSLDTKDPCPHCGKRFRRAEHLKRHSNACRAPNSSTSSGGEPPKRFRCALNGVFAGKYCRFYNTRNDNMNQHHVTHVVGNKPRNLTVSKELMEACIKHVDRIDVGFADAQSPPMSDEQRREALQSFQSAIRRATGQDKKSNDRRVRETERKRIAVPTKHIRHDDLRESGLDFDCDMGCPLTGDGRPVCGDVRGGDGLDQKNGGGGGEKGKGAPAPAPVTPMMERSML